LKNNNNSKSFKILAFETSCDDTSVAVVDNNYNILANLTSSQPIHELYGGVVPELASRLHLKNIMYLTKSVIKDINLSIADIDAIAVSINPGLIGSLLVGVSFAKALAFSEKKPIIAINHIVGHIYANKIENVDLEPPYLALIVSGGHTELVDFRSSGNYEIVGRTRDDAAGEAFDKTAILLKLGYPGGPIIDKLAKTGNPHFHNFPRAFRQKDSFDFSFSGLKTSIVHYLNNADDNLINNHKNDIAASVQAAIIDPLVAKTINYAKKHHISKILVAGGVAANTYLREQISHSCKKSGFTLFIPALKYCMDNAAMIGAAAIEKFEKKEFAPLTLNAFSTKGLRIL